MTWPSSYQPGTLGYLVDRIDDDLVRSGTLNSEILNAVLDAVNIYQKTRLRFNETFTGTFQTVGGQQNYNAITDANFSEVAGPQQFYYIEAMMITVGFAVFDLPRIQPEELLILTQTGTQMGQPYCYAFDNETIMLYPVPSNATAGAIGALSPLVGGNGYTNGNFSNVPLSGGSGSGATANIFVSGGVVQSLSLVYGGQNYNVGDQLSCLVIGSGVGFSVGVTTLSTGGGPFKISVMGQVKYGTPVNTPTGLQATGNRWFTDGERLIRSRAKYELAIHVINDTDLATRMSPMDPPNGMQPGAAWLAYKELKGEANKMTGRGIIRPMYF